MAEENRRISTTPIPVPVLPGGAPSAAPTPSPLSQAPVAAGGEGDAPVAPTDAPAPASAEAAATVPASGEASTETPTEAPIEVPIEAASTDVTMTDAVSADKAATPAPAPAPITTTSAASPAPARTSTPLRTSGPETSSRAASQHPDPGFTMPPEAPPHGAPTRQYLNSKVTGAVLDGMKLIAKERPNDPLRVLGEFLLQRSKEMELSQ